MLELAGPLGCDLFKARAAPLLQAEPAATA
jgi:hypothetical protein